MKTILILLSVFATAYCGVGVTTPEIEREAYRLWNQFCDGQSEGGNNDGVLIFCKRPRGVIKQSFEHTLELTPKEGGSQQVVFIKPPSYHYKHDVIVSGGGGRAAKTVIYVKSAKNTHEVNVKDNTEAGQGPSKPTLFFLKGSHGAESSTDKDSVPLTTPDNTYLPPTTQKPGYVY